MAKFEIHVSELKSYLRCRRSFYWSSRIGYALEPIRPYRPFYLGRGVHHGLQVYYDTGVHPGDAYATWADEQERLFAEELGIWDDEIRETLSEMRGLGKGMLDHYITWAPQYDEHLAFVAMELEYKLPIPSPSGRASSRVYLAGRFDGLVQDKRTGLFWLFETKTSKSKQGNAQAWLQNDLQAGVYVWAAQEIYGVDVAGVLYNFLLKKVPAEPRELKNGRYSVAQNAIAGTTYEVFRAALAKRAARDLELDPRVASLPDVWPDDYEPGQDWERIYFDYRRDLYNEYKDPLLELWERGNPFFWRDTIRRTPFQLRELMMQVHHIALEMVRPSTVMYPSPDFFNCQMCLFREPCLLRMAGGDYKFLLEHDYQRRKLWEETDGEIKAEG